jgi:hypothetical protein
MFTQPPHTNLFHPKRIIVNLLLKILARFHFQKLSDESAQGEDRSMTNQRSLSPISSRMIENVVRSFYDYSLLPAFIHCAIEDSNYVPLTMDDCQFIFWFLRESCSCIGLTNFDGSSEILRESLSWFHWLFLGEVSLSSGMRNRGSIAYAPNSKAKMGPRAVDQRQSVLVSKDWNIVARMRLPDGLPLVTNVLKMIIVQELRMLITGFNDDLSLLNDDDLINAENTSAIFSLPSWKDPVAAAAVNPEIQKRSKFKKSRNNFHEIKFSVLSSSSAFKNTLLNLGCLKSLLEFCFGDRTPKGIQATILNFGKSISLHDELIEMEKELWWLSVVFLFEMIRGSKEAKEELDKIFGLKKIIKLILQILESFADIPSFVETLFSLLLIELTVDGPPLSTPAPPFIAATSSFPKSLTQSGPAARTSADVFARSLIHLPVKVEADPINWLQVVPAFNSLSSIYFSFDFMANWSSTVFLSQCFEPSDLSVLIEDPYSRISQADFVVLGSDHIRVSSEENSQHTPSKDYDTSPLPPEILSRPPQQRRSSRKNVSSASIHSLGDENRWEVESIGKLSAVQGDVASRGSLNSHQSIQAVMQAIKSTPAHILLAPSHTQSDSNQNLDSINSNQKKTLSLPKPDSLSKFDITEIQNFFPFPPFYKLSEFNEVPSCGSNLLTSFDHAGSVGFGKVMVLCHNYLLSTSGLSRWMNDEIFEDGDFFDNNINESPRKSTIDSIHNEWFHSEEAHSSSFPSLTSVDGYYFLLRKHLSFFMLQFVHNSQKQQLFGYNGYQVVSNSITWCPTLPYCRFRNEQSLDAFVALILVSKPRMRLTLLRFLLVLIEANPTNARLIGYNNSMTFILTKLLTSLSSISSFQEYLGTILTNVFSYVNNLASLRFLLHDSIQFTTSLSPTDNSTISENRLNQTVRKLYIIGKSIEPNLSPFSYLQFDLKPALKSCLMLPPFSDSGSITTGNLTFSCWIRVGAMGNVPMISLLQLIGEPAGIIINVSFRKLKSENEPSESGSSLQLCLSFNKKAKESQFEQHVNLNEDFTKDSSWNTAMNHLLGLEDTGEFVADSVLENHSLKDIYSSISNISQSFVKFAFPDCVVDYPWKEMGSWHLLVLNFHSEGISCFVDGNERPLLYFSPFGYISQSNLSQTPKHIGNEKCSIYKIKNLFKSLIASLEKGSKGNSLTAALGGLLFEKSMFQDISSILSSQVQQNQNFAAKSLIQRLMTSYTASIKGFSGLIGDVVFLDGKIDSDLMLHVLRDGPSKGLQLIKGRVLSSLIQQNPFQSTSATTSDSLRSPSASAKSTPSRPISNTDPIMSVSSSWDSDALTPFLNQKEPGNNSLFIQRNVSFTKSLKYIGGLKLLFPFFYNENMNLIISGLRVLSNFIYDDEDYQLFQLENYDRALLYAFSYSRTQSIEVCQVLFDMATLQSNNFSQFHSSSIPSNVQSLEVNEKIKRIEILKLIMDLSLVCFPNYAISRTILDWIKQLILNSKENLFLFMKHIGIIPLQIMITKWTIVDFNEIIKLISNFEAKESSSGAQLQPAGDSFVELDRKRVSFYENPDSNQGGGQRQSQRFASRHESIASTITTATNYTNTSNNTNNSGNSGNSNEDPILRPIDLSDRKSVTINPKAVVHLPINENMKIYDSTQDFLAIYKVHLLSVSAFRTIFTRLFTENLIESYLKTMNEPVDCVNALISNYISFTVACSRYTNRP